MRVRSLPWWAWPVLVVASEAVVLVVAVPTSWHDALGGDGLSYQTYAENLLHHGVYSLALAPPYYPGITRSPGYPALLMALDAVGGRHAWLIQLIQIALVAATSVLVGLIARAFVRPGVALVGSLMCASYLPLLGYATRFVTEVPATTLVVVIVWLAVRIRLAWRVRDLLALGIALTAVGYVRPDLLTIALPVAVGLVVSAGPARSRVARGAALGLIAVAAALLIVPWVVRDSSVTGGKFVPLAATNGQDLLASADQYAGYMSDASTVADFARFDVQAHTVLRAAGLSSKAPSLLDARAQYAQNEALKSAATMVLGQVSATRKAEAIPERIRNLWWTADEASPPRIDRVWVGLADVQFAFLVVAALWGAAVRWRTFFADWPLWSVAVTITIIHLYFSIEARYSLEARPMLMIYSAVGLASMMSEVGRRIGWKQLGAVRVGGQSAGVDVRKQGLHASM